MVGVGVIRPQGRIIRDFAEAKSIVEPDHPAYGRIIRLPTDFCVACRTGLTGLMDRCDCG